jgi:mRNA interferase MazF
LSKAIFNWADLRDPIGSSPAHTRPVVVLQNNYFNQSRLNTVIACVITTNLKRAVASSNVLLYAGEGGLAKDSVVVTSQIVTLDKAELREYVGTLSRKHIHRVLAGLRLLTEPREADEKATPEM